jgi:hypothetical protein
MSGWRRNWEKSIMEALDRLDMLAHLHCMRAKLNIAKTENEKDIIFDRWFTTSGHGLEELYGCSHEEAVSILREFNAKPGKDFLGHYMRALDPNLKRISPALRNQFMIAFFD